MNDTKDKKPDFSDLVIKPFAAHSALANPICKEAFTY
jgi:hypothetical protein